MPPKQHEPPVAVYARLLVISIGTEAAPGRHSRREDFFASYVERTKSAPTTPCKSVDEYIASQPAAVQSVLNQVRTAIRKAQPKAEEVTSYKIPAYKLHGSVVLYFAGWKQHYSLYPVGAPLVAAFQDELAPYKVSKGTIRFPLSQPVPVKLIERVAKFRAKELAQQETAKEPPRKKRQARKPPRS